eukprot:426746-Rhodomonas_salina.1
MYGANLGYAATKSYVMYGTDPDYATTRSSHHTSGYLSPLSTSHGTPTSLRFSHAVSGTVLALFTSGRYCTIHTVRYCPSTLPTHCP